VGAGGRPGGFCENFPARGGPIGQILAKTFLSDSREYRTSRRSGQSARCNPQIFARNQAGVSKILQSFSSASPVGRQEIAESPRGKLATTRPGKCVRR